MTTGIDVNARNPRKFGARKAYAARVSRLLAVKCLFGDLSFCLFNVLYQSRKLGFVRLRLIIALIRFAIASQAASGDC